MLMKLTTSSSSTTQTPCYMFVCTYAPNYVVKFDRTTDIVCICVTMEEVAQLVANKVIVQNIILQAVLKVAP